MPPLGIAFAIGSIAIAAQIFKRNIRMKCAKNRETEKKSFIYYG